MNPRLGELIEQDPVGAVQNFREQQRYNYDALGYTQGNIDAVTRVIINIQADLYRLQVQDII